MSSGLHGPIFTISLTVFELHHFCVADGMVMGFAAREYYGFTIQVEFYSIGLTPGHHPVCPGSTRDIIGSGSFLNPLVLLVYSGSRFTCDRFCFWKIGSVIVTLLLYTYKDKQQHASSQYMSIPTGMHAAIGCMRHLLIL